MLSKLCTTLLFHSRPVHWKDGDLSRPPFLEEAYVKCAFKLPPPFRLQNRLVPGASGAYVHNTFLFLCVVEKVTFILYFLYCPQFLYTSLTLSLKKSTKSSTYN